MIALQLLLRPIFLFCVSTNCLSVGSLQQVPNLGIRSTKVASAISPPRVGSGAAQVYVGFYVESVGNFKPTEMAFDVDLYLRLSWTDHRLRNQTDTEVALDRDLAFEQIWIPDIYFANARKAYSQIVTVTNIGGTLYSDGTVALSRRVTLSVACNMNLQNYPLDRQKCYIRLGSYSNNRSKVNISWFSQLPISYNPHISLPELEIIKMTPQYCNAEFAYPVTEQFVTMSNFSCLKLQIYLRRSITYHVVQSYVPTALIVIISWVSFWIDPEAVPARVSLSFTTLLTLSTMGAGLRYSLPAVSYAKAIDYWYGMCMMFIFAALIEFAVVNSFMRSGKKCQAIGLKLMEKKCVAEDCDEAAAAYGVAKAKSSIVNRAPKQDQLQELLPIKLADDTTPPLRPIGTRHQRSPPTTDDSARMGADFTGRAAAVQRKAVHVDQGCRVAFPAAFALFNLIYWALYLIV